MCIYYVVIPDVIFVFQHSEVDEIKQQSNTGVESHKIYIRVFKGYTKFNLFIIQNSNKDMNN